MSVTRNLHFRGKYVKGESENGRNRIEVVLGRRGIRRVEDFSVGAFPMEEKGKEGGGGKRV